MIALRQAAMDRTAAITTLRQAAATSSYRLVQSDYLVFGVIEALLAIRFALRALGANSDAGSPSSSSTASPRAWWRRSSD